MFTFTNRFGRTYTFEAVTVSKPVIGEVVGSLDCPATKISCTVRGVKKSITVPVELAEMRKCSFRWTQGEPLQNALRVLTPGQREFLLTGMTEDEWAEMMREEEE